MRQSIVWSVINAILFVWVIVILGGIKKLIMQLIEKTKS